MRFDGRAVVARACLVVLILAAGGCEGLYRHLGGRFRGPPEFLTQSVSPEALRLIELAFEDIDPAELMDHHVHLMTMEVHPDWLDPLRVLDYGRLRVYLSASGVSPKSLNPEQDYVDRLLSLNAHQPAPTRMVIYAMDRTYRRDGGVDLKHTEFYVSNDYIHARWQQRPDLLVPAVSIHPYRRDAVQQLERWAALGVRYVKWLPNTMAFDPSDDLLEPFYAKARELDMVLLCHTGHEGAVDAMTQEYGNPLLLRKALDMGVKVVALHAASERKSLDLDHPQARKSSSFDLLMRLMDDPRYDGLLFAEISTVTFAHHLERPLRVLLERRDLHHRLINGSDYPFCAVAVAIRPKALADAGFVTEQEAHWLAEIYRFNPLLYDFVVKRTVRHPQTGGRFSPVVFTDLEQRLR
jgi:uncharacterized protein